jgi:hypothetical protein
MRCEAAEALQNGLAVPLPQFEFIIISPFLTPKHSLRWDSV